MKPITIEPRFEVEKPPIYIQTNAVSFTGIDGEERCPWIEEITVEDLLKILGD